MNHLKKLGCFAISKFHQNSIEIKHVRLTTVDMSVGSLTAYQNMGQNWLSAKRYTMQEQVHLDAKVIESSLAYKRAIKSSKDLG